MSDYPKSYTFRSLYKVLDNKNHVINWRKFEVYFSFILSALITISMFVMYFTSRKQSAVEFLVKVSEGFSLASIFGLVGMLGFIISGLAIISGTIGNKITHQIIASNGYKSLLAILFSFYYIGYIIAFTIVLFIIAHLLVQVPAPFIPFLFFPYAFINLYLLFFIIFSTVSLLGTCINVFQLSYLYSEEKKTGDKLMLIQEIKINSLTKILHNKLDMSKKDFIDTINECIENDVSEHLKKEMKEHFENYYR